MIHPLRGIQTALPPQPLLSCLPMHCPRLLSLVLIITLAACAPHRVPGSYLPVGASALYGDRTEDGVVVLLRSRSDDARMAVRSVLESNGFVVEDASARAMRTRPLLMGNDTSVVVQVEIIPVQLPEDASSVVLTATYSVPSKGVGDWPVIRRRGETSPLFERLRSIGQALRSP